MVISLHKPLSLTEIYTNYFESFLFNTVLCSRLLHAHRVHIISQSCQSLFVTMETWAVVTERLLQSVVRWNMDSKFWWCVVFWGGWGGGVLAVFISIICSIKTYCMYKLVFHICWDAVLIISQRDTGKRYTAHFLGDEVIWLEGLWFKTWGGGGVGTFASWKKCVYFLEMIWIVILNQEPIWG